MRESFSVLWQNFIARFWKRKITCPQELFEKDFFSGKNYEIIVFWGNWAGKNFDFWQKHFGRVVKTAFDVSIGSFWEVFFGKKILFFHHSCTLSKHFSAISQRFCSSVVGDAFYVSRRTFWGETLVWKIWEFFLSFSDIEQNTFDFLSNFFLVDLSKLHSTWPYQLLRKIFSEFFFNFGSFSTFCRHLFRRPSKLHSSSPENHSKEKQVFSRKFVFFLSSLDLPRKLSSLLAKVFIGRDMTIVINASIATNCGEILF